MCTTTCVSTLQISEHLVAFLQGHGCAISLPASLGQIGHRPSQGKKGIPPLDELRLPERVGIAQRHPFELQISVREAERAL